MPLVQPMVAALGLVHKLIRHSTKQSQNFVHVVVHRTMRGVDHNVFAPIIRLPVRRPHPKLEALIRECPNSVFHSLAMVLGSEHTISTSTAFACARIARINPSIASKRQNATKECLFGGDSETMVMFSSLGFCRKMTIQGSPYGEAPSRRI